MSLNRPPNLTNDILRPYSSFVAGGNQKLNESPDIVKETLYSAVQKLFAAVMQYAQR